jgi:hypothetical protein
MPTPVTATWRCPRAECRAVLRQALQSTGPIAVSCPGCNQPVNLEIDEPLARDRVVSRCPVCRGAEFFIRKDFPQKAGLALVVLFGLIASGFYYYGNVIATFATLATLVIVDAAIYFFVARVTVCYRCRAEYRGFAYNPEHSGFDLATSEKYD